MDNARKLMGGLPLVSNQWVVFCNPRLSGRPEDVRPEELGPMMGPFTRVFVTYSALFGQTRTQIFQLAGMDLETEEWVVDVQEITGNGGVPVEGLELPELLRYSDFQILPKDPDVPWDEEDPRWKNRVRVSLFLPGVEEGPAGPGNEPGV